MVYPVQQIGYGSAPGHAGEIAQGALETGGVQTICVATLVAPHVRAQARFVVDTESNGVTVTPGWKSKAGAAARLMLQHIQAAYPGGHLEIGCSIETLPGRGLGSSTMDVLASLTAVADAYGLTPTPEKLGRLCVQAEGASDATMFGSEAVIFASRQGQVLERLPRPFPRVKVLTFDTAPAASAGVETTGFRPRYSLTEISAFEDLLSCLRQATATQDAALLGRVATQSAMINQAYNPTPRFGDLLMEKTRMGACVGVAVAHSGTVASYLFDPAHPGASRQAECAWMRLSLMGLHPLWHWSTGDSQSSPSAGSGGE